MSSSTAWEGIVFRHAVMQRIRAFFLSEDFIEVETPIRLKIPCMEAHIEAEPSGDSFLRTSPEIFHKRLLGAGMTRIFEIGKCFRKGELGAIHHPEYTMLEWYRTQSDYMGVLEDTRRLLKQIWPKGPTSWSVLKVKEAFLEFAGWDPTANYDADRFDLDLVEKVEPAFQKMGGVVVLKDYPIEAAALSKKSQKNPTEAERWELYVEGIELANAYSELTDPSEQRARFEACAQERAQRGMPTYGIDERFLSALEKMPPTGGVALGLDRLLMLMRGEKTLDGVLPFRNEK